MTNRTPKKSPAADTKKIIDENAKVMNKLAARQATPVDETESNKARWGKYGSDNLVGRTIIAVRYMSQQEVEDLGWYCAGVVLQLDGGSLIYPSRDDEGNDAGALFGQTKDGKDITLPVI